MAYNPNIPQPPDIKSVSQPQILNNFIAINDLLAVNHQTFGASGEGKHKFLQMPEQGSAPLTTVNEAALYAAVGAASSQAELVFKRETPAINATVPATVAFTECLANASDGSTGWTMLPSGIIMKWGQLTITAGTGVETFSSSFPKYCYTVQITSWENGDTQNFVSVNRNTVTKDGFTAKCFTRTFTGSNMVISYLAIGI